MNGAKDETPALSRIVTECVKSQFRNLADFAEIDGTISLTTIDMHELGNHVAVLPSGCARSGSKSCRATDR